MPLIRICTDMARVDHLKRVVLQLWCCRVPVYYGIIDIGTVVVIRPCNRLSRGLRADCIPATAQRSVLYLPSSNVALALFLHYGRDLDRLLLVGWVGSATVRGIDILNRHIFWWGIRCLFVVDVLIFDIIEIFSTFMWQRIQKFSIRCLKFWALIPWRHNRFNLLPSDISWVDKVFIVLTTTGLDKLF